MTTKYSRLAPSPRFTTLIGLYETVHETGIEKQGINASDVFAGTALYDHIPDIGAIARRTKSRSVLDYGSGKATLYDRENFPLGNGEIAKSIKDYWGVDEITCYDPGVKEISTRPTRKFDGVVCTDVLEHIPEEDIDWFLEELFGFADKFVYANIAAYPAEKTLPNGWNAHVTIKEAGWWKGKIEQAARKWHGKDYHFVVSKPTRGLTAKARKAWGLSKWRKWHISAGAAAASA